MNKKLSDLHPIIKPGQVIFDCPVCIDDPEPGKRHTVLVDVSPEPFHKEPYDPPRYLYKDHKIVRELLKPIWQMSGTTPEDLTLSPSINICEVDKAGNAVRTICWHGHVTIGMVT